MARSRGIVLSVLYTLSGLRQSDQQGLGNHCDFRYHADGVGFLLTGFMVGIMVEIKFAEVRLWQKKQLS